MDGNVFETAGEKAYRIIQGKILSGEFKPGFRISLRKMAEQTGTSVIPVLEAVKRLQGEMLIQSKPQWGYYVTVPSFEKIWQTYQIREALECFSARYLAIHPFAGSQKEKLYDLATQLDTIPYTEETKVQIQEKHIQFHLELTRATGNELMLEDLRKMNLFWILSKSIATNAPRAKYPRYWHRMLMDEIGKGDPDNAERKMRTHVEDSFILIKEQHEQGLI